MQPETTRLEHLAVLEFAGADAGRFLQAQLTADIAALGAGQSGLAACCNPAGRVLGVLLLQRTETGFFAVCAAELADPLTEWLRRFVLRAKVSLASRPDLAVYADAAPAAGVMALAALRRSYRVGAAGAACADPGAWRRAELESGLVWLGAASTGAFLPQMLGLERLGALSFKKGCYPGQEVIARARHLGRLKRHPLLCAAAGCPGLERMQAVELAASDGSEGSAVVVASEPLPEGGSLNFLVARLDPAATPVRLGADGAWWPLERFAWLTGAASEAGA